MEDKKLESLLSEDYAQEYKYLIKDLNVDTSAHWSKWDWKTIGDTKSYNFARLEEYRDSVIVSYRLYNQIGLEHLKNILKGTSKDSRLLDAGGGTGRKSIPIALEGFNNITLLDYAPDWLRLAKEKAEKIKIQDNITYIEGNILNMDKFEDNTFDVVFALGGVATYCGNIKKAIQELVRVLKPDGKLLIDGIHNVFAGLSFFVNNGDLNNVENIANSLKIKDSKVNNLGLGGMGIFPEDLLSYAQNEDLKNINIWSEFLFVPDDNIRINENTLKWEEISLSLEMQYYQDPRFLGKGSLILSASK